MNHFSRIAHELGINPAQAEAVAKLLDEGATVPFIARYRKEVHGSLDEVAVVAVRDRLEQLRELDARREAVIKSLAERELLTPDLSERIAGAAALAELEDIYLPFRPKRRTRASIAREKGLEPLAVSLLEQTPSLRPLELAASYADAEKGVPGPEDALAGARDIIAEMVSEDAPLRGVMREFFGRKAQVAAKVAKGKEEEGAKFRDYFDWQEPATGAAGHRILAMLRGESEGFLSLHFLPDAEAALALVRDRFVKNASPAGEQVREAVDDGYKRLLAPSMETELRAELKRKAEDEAIAVLQGCVGVAAGTEPLTARVMDAVPGLRVISRCGVGMDSVDLEAAAARNIQVRNTPEGPTRAVVELTLGCALDLMRRVTQMDRDVRNGVWKKRMGNLLQGKNLGIIGFGRIGRAVAEVFAFMGCRVSFYDPFVTGDQGAFQRRETDDLLAWADIITLHCAKPADGSQVLDASRVASMKQGAWLINAARGGLVDEEALAEALRSGRLSGAALDVFAKEPYAGPLAELPTAVLTPHIGSYARESRVQMEMDTIRNLLDALGQADATR